LKGGVDDGKQVTRMKERSDQQLLDDARAGDRRALEALLARIEPRVYRFGMKLCHNPEDASDILQETLLAMARGVKDFRGASSVSTWLYTIARSYCIKKRRRSKYAPESETSLHDTKDGEAALQLADPSRSPDDALAGRQVEEALERAIRSLDDMYREVLVLRDVEGLTAPEVAEVMGLSVEAVKSRLHRARLSVRESVAPALGAPGPAPRSREGCPDVVRLFSQHLEGEISSSLCADLEGHLAGCPACAERCASLQRTLAVCKSMPLARVPEPVQAGVRRALKRFVDLGS
jgi:RNA polymerase sigma-70 factor, ECF subfamily